MPAAARPAFRDRADAGRQLASRLAHLAGRTDVTVLGLPRGGVPVAAVVAPALGAPLGLLLARKLGVPGRPELAMGAVAPGPVRVLNRSVVDSLGVPPEVIEEVVRREEAELARRQAAYAGLAEAPVGGRVAVVVDDGLATGATMAAAVAALGVMGPSRVVVAAPVGAAPTCRSLASEADEVVCLYVPPSFQAVGEWYADFTQTTDEEIRLLLADL